MKNIKSYSALSDLIKELNKMPGIGKKSAIKLAYYLMKIEKNEALALSQAIINLKEKTVVCSICFNRSETDPCNICNDTERDKTKLCIVENAPDLWSIEKLGIYNGYYHVLEGHISPLENITAENLKIKELIKKIENNPEIKEIILSLNTNINGNLTTEYLVNELKRFNRKIYRIAIGLPLGADIEVADALTMAAAFNNKIEIKT